MKVARTFSTVAVFACVAVSGSMAISAARTVGAATLDRTCAARIARSDRVAAPGGYQWVWAIPGGCAWLRNGVASAACPTGEDGGCMAVPDVVVRYKQRNYTLTLPTTHFASNAAGLSNIVGDRVFSVAAGRGSYTRVGQAVITVSAREYDGVLESGPNQGRPTIGARHTWIARLQLGVRSLQLIGFLETP